jgi:putative ABC transport system substrate-binding protein
VNRRDAVALLGAAVAWPVRAQQPARIPRLGVLLFSTPEADPQMQAFRRGLRDLGYVDGHNITIEYRYAEGRPERLPGLAAELVQANPDVLFSIGGDVSSIAVNATSTIPIVFTSSTDPVGKLVASLARPGGNATGVTFLMDELASKRLGLLKEAAPNTSRVAFLWNPDHVDNELRVAERAALALAVQLQPLEVRGPADFNDAFQGAAKARSDALCVTSSRLMVRNLDQIVGFAAKNRLPLVGGWGAWTQNGGLLSYGPNINDMVRLATTYLDKILKGTKPADLPVQQPTKFDLSINLKTARALGLEIPPTLLARADDVIE